MSRNDETREETRGPAAPPLSHNEPAVGRSTPPPIPPQTAHPSPLHTPRRGLTGIQIAFIVLGVILTLAFPATMFWRFGETRDMARDVTVQANLRSLGFCTMFYAEDNDYSLPSADTFVTDLANYTAEDASIDEMLISPLAPDAGRAYSMNALLSHVRTSDVREPKRTVLFFETEFGSPPAAGPGHLPDKPRHAEGYCIVFVDGHVEFVSEVFVRLGTITWGTLACTSCKQEFEAPTTWRPPQPLNCPACGKATTKLAPLTNATEDSLPSGQRWRLPLPNRD